MHTNCSGGDRLRKEDVFLRLGRVHDSPIPRGLVRPRQLHRRDQCEQFKPVPLPGQTRFLLRPYLPLHYSRDKVSESSDELRRLSSVLQRLRAYRVRCLLYVCKCPLAAFTCLKTILSGFLCNCSVYIDPKPFPEILSYVRLG